MLTLYGYNFRSRAERVEWALNELELDYEFIRLDPAKGETGTEEFLALNPSRKIPVLVHNGVALTESLAIMEYLNDISPVRKIIPEDTDGKFGMRQAIHFVATELEAYLWIADQCARMKDKYPWPEGTKEEALARVESAAPAIERFLSKGEFVSGHSFSIADIYLYHCLMWTLSYAIKLPRPVLGYIAVMRKRSGIPDLLKA